MDLHTSSQRYHPNNHVVVISWQLAYDDKKKRDFPKNDTNYYVLIG